MTSSEAQTRSELIDQQLALSGWNINDPTQIVEEFDILTSLPEGFAEPRIPYVGHQFSDYVLLGKDCKVVGFPTRDDLERFTYIRRNRKPLSQEFINTSIVGRDNQIRAIRSVLEDIELKKRNFLLVMATGQCPSHLDLVDEPHKKEWEFGPQHEAVSIGGYRELVEALIGELTKVEKNDLINSSFTVIHPQGNRGVFSPAEINEILLLTESLAD